MLQGITTGYRRLGMGYKRLQGATRGYRRLKEVTGG